MQVKGVVTNPSWFKLPARGGYEGVNHADRVWQNRHARNDHDDVDRTPDWCQKLPDILDVAARFLVARYNRYACSGRPHESYLASPIVGHVKPSVRHSHIFPASYAHIHTVQLRTECPDLASVHPVPEYPAGVIRPVPRAPAAAHRLKVAELWNLAV